MRNRSSHPEDLLIFDRAGIRETDVKAIGLHGMTGLVLMENAARESAMIAMDMIEKDVQNPVVAIVCGRGNNGGDGYAIARHLHNRGIGIQLLSSGQPRPGSDAQTNARIAETMGLERVANHECLTSVNLIVDALLGTGLDREVAGEDRRLIEAMNTSKVPILSIDLPSGLDADTGKPLDIAVRATETVTFVGLKIGLLQPAGEAHAGRIHIVDIGIPQELARSLALKQPNDGTASDTEL